MAMQWRLGSHRTGLVLVGMGVIWMLLLLLVTLRQHGGARQSSTAQLREQILRLSREYVHRLTLEKDDVFAGTSGHDLKSTIAVLMENILSKVVELENDVDRLYNCTRLKRDQERDRRDSSHEIEKGNG
uniref:Coiled-coil domain-containing protein 126 n=1 Tax=Petromyzon marinus TaxID=7757 RepID=A0AAJ7T7N4_PETMA|nr:coiled-coil domain-containing protein 126 [Petromyzon marinus]